MDINKILNPTNKNNYTAMFGWQNQLGGNLTTFGYITSYKDCADLLVEQQAPDLYMFPIMFNYRQYLEQLLKNICERNMDKKAYIGFIKNASHNLSKVWETAKKFLRPILVSSNDIDIIESLVLFFHKIDQNSFTFRYEKDKKQNPSIKNNNLIIDTLELKKYVDKVDDILYFTYGV